MKDRRLQLRVSETDLEMVRRLAEAEQRTVSGYVRWLISLAVDRKQLLKDMSHDN